MHKSPNEDYEESMQRFTQAQNKLTRDIDRAWLVMRIGIAIWIAALALEFFA